MGRAGSWSENEGAWDLEGLGEVENGRSRGTDRGHRSRPAGVRRRLIRDFVQIGGVRHWFHECIVVRSVAEL